MKKGQLKSAFHLSLLLLWSSGIFGCERFVGRVSGTYVSGVGFEQRAISIEPQNHAFYYTDQANEIFIKGTIERQSSDSFFLSCDHEENEQIIERQIVVCSGLTFTMTIGNSKVGFKKIEDVPSMIANASYH